MKIKIEPSWEKFLKKEFSKEYFSTLVKFVKSENLAHRICPPGPYIFRAFEQCPVEKLKVVIIGQDPYHTPNVANGLAFSATEGQRIPPSLLNIYKEIKSDLGVPIPTSPDLTRWAEQGVLLLNATLTVRQGVAGSHQYHGWEDFTDAVIKNISQKKSGLVFLLWGAYAQKKKYLIDGSNHLILESAHPSPFSAERGFFGNKHFSKTNKYLETKKKHPIEW